jgi:hypothetical protein
MEEFCKEMIQSKIFFVSRKKAW